MRTQQTEHWIQDTLTPLCVYRDYHRPIKEVLRILLKFSLLTQRPPSPAPKYTHIRFLAPDYEGFGGGGGTFDLLPSTHRIAQNAISKAVKKKRTTFLPVCLHSIDSHNTSSSARLSAD